MSTISVVNLFSRCHGVLWLLFWLYFTVLLWLFLFIIYRFMYIWKIKSSLSQTHFDEKNVHGKLIYIYIYLGLPGGHLPPLLVEVCLQHIVIHVKLTLICGVFCIKVTVLIFQLRQRQYYKRQAEMCDINVIM